MNKEQDGDGSEEDEAVNINMLEEPPLTLDSKAEQRILDMISKQENRTSINVGRCFVAK